MCKKEEDCDFAHDEKDLRYTLDIYKTALCNNYNKGSCKLGDKCRFAHGESELKSKPAHLQANASPQKKPSYKKHSPQYQGMYFDNMQYQPMMYPYAFDQFYPPYNDFNGHYKDGNEKPLAEVKINSKAEQ